MSVAPDSFVLSGAICIYTRGPVYCGVGEKLKLPCGRRQYLPSGSVSADVIGWGVWSGDLPMSSSTLTRKKLLVVARKHLAERGYHGTSLAAVSGELGLTKQALLHHFKSKDLLYEAVLEQLGAELLELLYAAMEEGEQAEHQLESFLQALTAQGLSQPADLALLLRDLIDFPGRGLVRDQGNWPLQSLFEPLIALIQATQRWQGAGFAEALSVASQMLGAICQFPTAQAAFAGSFGQGAVDQVRSTFLSQTQDLVRGRLGERQG